MTDTTTAQPGRLAALLTQEAADAANRWQHRAEYRDALAALPGIAARRCQGTTTDPAGVAAVASLTVALLLEQGHDASTAARLATFRAAGRAHEDEQKVSAPQGMALAALDDEESAAAKEAATLANGAPLDRLALSSPPAPDALARTTDTDRLSRAVALISPESRQTLDRLISAEPTAAKQGKRRDLDDLPAAALAAAAGRVYSGRAKVAALAEKRDALADLASAYRLTLDLDRIGAEPWHPYRWHADRLHRPTWTDADLIAAALAAHRSAEDARIKRDSLSRGDTRTSGPASQPVSLTASRRTLDRLGVLDGSARRRATEDDHSAAVAAFHALPTQPASACTLPAWRPASARQEARTAATDLDATSTENGSARAVAGVGAGIKVGAGTPAGTGQAFRKAAPRKRRREGAVGGSMTRA